MFHESSALLVNKIDLLPYVNCSVDKIREESLKINPGLSIFEVSATNDTGLEKWFAWLKKQKNDKDLSIKSNG